MDIQELVSQLKQADIRIEVKSNKLMVHAPKGAVTDELGQKIKQNKDSLITLFETVTASSQDDKFWVIPKCDRSQSNLASYAQQRMWFIDRLEDGSSQFNMLNHFVMQGDFDADIFKRVIETVIDRHESLRTCFKEENGQAVQIIQQHYNIPFVYFDLRDLNEEQKQAQIDHHIQIEKSNAFDLQSDILLRARVLCVSDNKHIVMYNVHHIASDGWSMRLLRREFDVIYKAYFANRKNPLEPLEIQYIDYSNWQRQWLQGEALDQQYNYWLKRLENIPQIHNLPLDKPRPANQRYQGKVYRQILDNSFLNCMHSLCRKFDVTMFMCMQTIFSILLHRYSNDADIIMGTSIAGRTHSEFESMIGLFINTLILRNDLSGNPSFSDVIAENKSNILDAFSHQHIPFELMLADKLKPQRSLSYNPIFQIMFTLRKNEHSEESGYEYTLDVNKDNDISIKFDFDLDVIELKDSLVLNWQYNTDLFFDATIRRIAENFSVLIKSIYEAPHKRISDLDLLSDREKHTILNDWNGTLPAFSDRQFLHNIFEEIAQTNPRDSAVVFGSTILTYGKLNARANQLSRYLLNLKIRPNALIAICMERCADIITAILGILKIGAAYVPIDPKYPASRIEYLQSDCEADLVITQLSLLKLVKRKGQPCLCLDSDSVKSKLQQEDIQNLSLSFRESNRQKLANIIYTSGTTGMPKGVMITHANLISYLSSARQGYQIKPDNRVLALSSVSFDIFTEELCLSVFSQGTLYISEQGALQDVNDLWQQIDRYKINCITLPTAYWSLLCNELNDSHCKIAQKHLTVCIVGGEELTSSSLNQWRKKVGVDIPIWNTYGPTETTIIASLADVRDHSYDQRVSPTIGRRLANTQLYVLNTINNFLQPIGVVGELCIGGLGVSEGYLKQPETSRHKFIQNPFNADPEARLYKSGDLVRLLNDASYEFVGRIDKQVKIRGFRIEPGEIEACLRKQHEVRDAIVTAANDGNNSKRLVAYLVTQKPFNAQLADKIKLNLRQTLPDYMVPSVFVNIETVPLTQNGKVDYSSLADPSDYDEPSRDYVAPNNDMQKRLCSIWELVLGLKRVGINDNFFDLGGHSLLATRLVSKIRQDLNIEISLRALFKYPTIAELSKSAYDYQQEDLMPPIERVPRTQKMPLSFAQQRIWFIDQLEGGSSQYNMPSQVQLEGRLDLESLKRAFEAFLQRHEVLRTYFVEVSGEVFQVIQHSFELPFSIKDLTHLDQSERLKQVKALAADDAQKAFNLSYDLPIRLCLINLDSDRHVLLFNMHHIASDAWSMDILHKELLLLYQAYTQNKANPLEPLKVQYADYAHWQRTWLKGKVLEKQMSYWRKQLQQIPLVHKLPLDNVRPKQQRFQGKSYRQLIGSALSRKLKLFCQDRRVTSFMLLQTVFSVLLSRYSCSSDIVMGTPVAGRTHVDLEPLIGFFINTLILRCDLSGNPKFVDYLEQNKQNILDAFTHQHIPFEMLVDELKPQRSLSYSPIIQILFSLQTAEFDSHKSDSNDSAIGKYERDQYVKFDLTLNALEFNKGVYLNWSYNSDLFDSESIHRISANFIELLNSIIDNPAAKLNDLNLISATETNKLLNEWSGSYVRKAADKCIQQGFERQVHQTPDNIAVIYGSQEITYQTLNMSANRLAHFLIHEGVTCNSFVGICMNRNIDMLVAIWGILKSGAAYVPIEPNTPDERIAYILNDADCQMLLTQQDLRERMQKCNVGLLFLDEPLQKSVLAKYSDENPGAEKVDLKQSNAAYVIYTSGSTGKPKGVIVEHKNLLSFEQAFNYQLEQQLNLKLDNWLWLSSYAFDASVKALLAQIRSATLIIPDKHQLEDIAELVRLIQLHNIQIVNAMPALIKLILAQCDSEQIGVNMIVSGEEIDLPFWQMLLEYKNKYQVKILNAYGPTETTVNATSALINDGKNTHIGKPLPNSRIFVLDQYHNLLPQGAIGELCISGGGVTRGYLKPGEHNKALFKDDCHDPALLKSNKDRRPDGLDKSEFETRIFKELKSQSDYWLKKINQAPLVHSLPLDYSRLSKGGYSQGTVSGELRGEVVELIKDFANRQNISLFMLLHATMALLISRYGDHDDVVIGTIIENVLLNPLNHGQGKSENIIPLRSSTNFVETQEYLKHIKQVNVEALANKEVPYKYILHQCNIQTPTNAAPLVQILLNLNLNNVYQMDEEFDLIINVEQVEDRMLFKWTFDQSIFEERYIQSIHKQFTCYLTSFSLTKSGKLSDVLLTIPDEVQSSIDMLNNSKKVHIENKFMHEIFEDCVDHVPNNIAVTFDDTEVSYRQLDLEANRLANYLLRDGMEKQTIVAILLEPGIDTIVALVAVLKSGGIFLPIDITYPESRVRYMLDDSGAKYILTHKKLESKVSAGTAINKVVLNSEEFKLELEKLPATRLNCFDDLTLSSLAYVIYTSGSSGRPKGVVIKYQGFLNYLMHAKDHYMKEWIEGSIVSSSISFDATITGLFAPLLTGKKVVIPKARNSYEMLPLLKQYLFDSGRSWLFNITPSHLDGLIEAKLEANSISRHMIVIGGEQFHSKTLLPWQKNLLPNSTFINEYGPTETVVASSIYEVFPDSNLEKLYRQTAVPIGTAIRNTQFYVLDEKRQIQAMGAIGELYIGGAGVGLGYLNRLDLTEERFIEDHLSGLPGYKLYKTGDLVRWRGDGQLEFIGRSDEQVKVNGYRVELGEIQAALVNCKGVNDAVVVYGRRNISDIEEAKQLIAYIVMPPKAMLCENAGQNRLIEEFKASLRYKLPDYMVPEIYVFMESIPLTVNGKIDFRSLPEPKTHNRQLADYVAPQNPIQKVLCDICLEILHIEKISIMDNFFHLGGNSLLVFKLINLIKLRLGAEISIHTIFDQPTISAMASALNLENKNDQIVKIAACNNDQAVPLSFAQQRLWFLDQLQGSSPQYNLPLRYYLDCELDIESFKLAIEKIINRHKILRSRYYENDGKPLQKIDDKFSIVISEYDFSHESSKRKKEKLEHICRLDVAKPFQLSKDLMLRVLLFKLSNNKYVIQFNMHHIASDGYSVGIFLKELSRFYQSITQNLVSELDQLPMQYADYAVWQQNLYNFDQFENNLNYWKQKLEGVGDINSLYLDKPRPERRRYIGRVFRKTITTETKIKIDKFCTKSNVTLFMFFQAIYSLLVGRYSNETDIVTGAPIAGRHHAGSDKLIGFFVNTLILRCTLSGNPSFSEFMADIKKTILDAYEHQDVPFEAIVEYCKPQRSLAINPIVQIVLVMLNADDQKLMLSNKCYQPEKLDYITAKFDLCLSIIESDSLVELEWEYDIDLFDNETIHQLANSFEVLIDNILIDPQQSVQGISLLNHSQQSVMIEKAYSVDCNYPNDKCIHALFEERVIKSPNKIAVICEDRKISYQELDKKANKLANYLLDQGIQTESVVALCVERSIDMVTGMLGILKAGAAYLPIDPDYPLARKQYILQDARAELMLAQASTFSAAPKDFTKTVLLESDEINQYPDTYIDCQEVNRNSKNLAYLIYTSGTSGLPKGVMTEHLSVVRLVCKPDYVTLDTDTVMLNASSVSFDAATFELWGCLLNGGCLVIYPQRLIDISKLNALITDRKINTMWLTAGLFDQWSHQLPTGRHIKWVLTGGDIVNPISVKRVYDYIPQVTVVNGYGPTENTTFTCCYSIPRDFDAARSIPIGKSINGTRNYVMQNGRHMAPPGSIGELYTAGDGLARGYINADKLNLEKFVKRSVHYMLPHERLYRTGDLVRLRSDGYLEFIGRIDQQVKIRGYRIEPGEIETQLTNLDDVDAACVVAWADQNKDNRLVAYIVIANFNKDPEAETKNSFQKEDVDRFKQALNAQLPEYMVPEIYIRLASLPLTSNGKVDRKKLPLPSSLDIQKVLYVAPSSGLERQLCEIVSNLLGLEKVGVHDNFFELGGHSLLAARLVSKIRQVLNLEVSLSDLFEYPTISKLSEISKKSHNHFVLPPIQRVDRNRRLKLSYAQQRLWFIDQLEGGSSQYNIPMQIPINGELNKDALVSASKSLLKRHEILRTLYVSENGEPYQLIIEDPKLSFEYTDLSNLDDKSLQIHLKNYIDKDLHKPFKLDKELPVRINLLKLKECEHLLIFNMHHIAGDGWSMDILQKEFEYLYDLENGVILKPLERLKIQYADYANWQHQWLKGDFLQEQLNYWKLCLNDMPQVHKLPLDKPRPEEQRFQGKSFRRDLDIHFSEKIYRFCQYEQITSYMFLQTVFAILISRQSNTDDIIMGTPIAGRYHMDIEPLIGFFVNTLILRTRINPDYGFSEILKKNKKQILQAYHHQYLPFEMLVDEINPIRDLSYNPLFQVMFSLRTVGSLQESEATDEPRSVYTKFDLNLAVLECEGSFSMVWQYNTDIFSDITIQTLSDYYYVLLTRILENPDKRISDYDLPAEAEKFHRLLNLSIDNINNKFINNPLPGFENEKMYKTGDLVRWRTDGNLQFIGRIDRQVKLRGFRIELGEVENCIRSHHWVKDAIVILSDGTSETRKLLAYVIYENGVTATQIDQVKSDSRLLLPHYMVPSIWIRMERFPLSITGKLDKGALPSPSEQDTQPHVYEAPRNEIEKALCQIWQDILETKRVGIHDDFFALGGHSLLVVRLTSKLRQSLKQEVSIRTVFEFPTVAGLAEFIRSQDKQGLVIPDIQALDRSQYDNDVEEGEL